MRFTSAAITSLFVVSLFFAGAAAAQSPVSSARPENLPAQQAQNEQQPANPAPPDAPQMRLYRTGSNEARIRPPIVVSQRRDQRGPGLGGPFRIFSELESDLDNPRIQTALGLSTQQVDSLRGILVNTEIYTIQNGAGILVDGIQLKQLLRSDHPDKSAVMAKGDAISQGVSQLINRYLNAILDAKNVLTRQQQDMIRRYMATRGQRMSGFASGGLGMGGPRPEAETR